MAERRNRFLNLEGARPPGPASSPHVSDRFRAPADPGAEKTREEEAPVDIDPLQAARRSQLESGLALDLHSDDEQPFTRCGQCETDTFRGATRCKTCGAQLDTPMQHAFNEALWQKRKAERVQEQAAVEQLKAGQRQNLVSSKLTAEQRAYGEALARQVHEQETTRLGWMSNETGSGLRPIGLRLLEKIPSPIWRFAIAGGLLALGLTLGWNVMTHRRGDQNPLVMLGFITLLGLFLPSRRRGLFSRGRFW